MEILASCQLNRSFERFMKRSGRAGVGVMVLLPDGLLRTKMDQCKRHVRNRFSLLGPPDGTSIRGNLECLTYYHRGCTVDEQPLHGAVAVKWTPWPFVNWTS